MCLVAVGTIVSGLISGDRDGVYVGMLIIAIMVK